MLHLNFMVHIGKIKPCSSVSVVVRLLPHSSVIIVQLIDVVSVGVSVVLVPHGILVHGSIGLGGGVVRRWDAVTGLTAVVAVPVIHCAVWVLVCSPKQWETERSEVGETKR